MKIGFVVPGTAPDGTGACRPLHDGVADLAATLRRHGHDAVVTELDATWWMVPPSTAVEQALSLVEVLDGCAAVVDHTGAWAGLVRRAGAAVNVLAPSPSAEASDAQRSFPDHGLPALDPLEVAAGTGVGGYVLVTEDRVGAGAVLAGLPLVVVPPDADRRERAALLADAAVFVAPEGVGGGWSALEALACATPVVAFEGTSAAQVVEDGVDGIVVRSTAGPAELIEAVQRAAALDRWACRHAAWERFPVERRAHDLIGAASVGGASDGSAPEMSPTAASNGRRELAASTA